MTIEDAFARVHAAAQHLPGVEAGTSYGTPAIKVKGKLMARMYDAETLVLRCSLESKEMLFQAAPEIYFETDHYRGWPALLVRLAAISDTELRDGLTQAWLMQAPPKLRASYRASA